MLFFISTKNSAPCKRPADGGSRKEKRMRDGAVEGVLLSGGLDSSLITYMALGCFPAGASA